MKKQLCFLLVFLGVIFMMTGVAMNRLDSRRQLPAAFKNSWIGLSAGVAKSYFTTADFNPNFQFRSQIDAITALRLTIGHYFNPYLALAMSLMRGAHANKFSDVSSTTESLSPEQVNTQFSVNENLFGITLRPTLPLKYGLGLYAEGGIGFISRKGFRINTTEVVNDASLVTALLGGGVYVKLPYGLLLDVETEYTPAMQSQKQPAIFYVGIGLNYLIQDTANTIIDTDQYQFPLNFLQVDYTNAHWFYADVAKYFTPPYIPIFFDGQVKIAQGLEFMYERNFFHTDKNFSLEWGVSVAGWQSHQYQQSFYTLSIFPELKVWIVRLPSFDFYFTYSLAGPTYISRVYIDHINSGSHFTFQDFLGFGAFIGPTKRWNINLKIVHYSNGNTLPQNPGVDVPIMLGVGVAW